MFLGVDVSKKTLDVALLSNAHTSTKPRHKVFANTAAGHQQLLAWLQSQQATSVHACLEATGTLGEAVALVLHEAGHQVSVVNPALIRAFGQSQLSRTKTDKADSQLIARFCQMHQPSLWNPPDPTIRELQSLVRRLETLDEMRVMEENRLESGVTSPEVRASIEEHIAYLQAQIEKTRRQIKDHIDQNPTLKGQRDLLTSIPGIGETTAALLLAEVDATQFESARQVAAFAGLVPRIRQSGTSVRGRSRLSKAGSSRLRKGLYFPAITALRFNPLIHALGQRLKEKGKSKMLIVGAAMRKLLHLAYGVLKSGKPFDPNYLVETA
jgi:transposase